jgi:hypothetical protein
MKGYAFAFNLSCRMTKPEVVHRPHAARQDVAQVAFYELRTF